MSSIFFCFFASSCRKRSNALCCNSVASISAWVSPLAIITRASASACATRLICHGLNSPPMAFETFSIRIVAVFPKSPATVIDVLGSSAIALLRFCDDEFRRIWMEQLDGQARYPLAAGSQPRSKTRHVRLPRDRRRTALPGRLRAAQAGRERWRWMTLANWPGNSWPPLAHPARAPIDLLFRTLASTPMRQKPCHDDGIIDG